MQKTTIVGVFEAPSYGFKKGKVVDFNEVVQSVGRVLSEIRNAYKPALRHIILGIPSVDFKMHRSRGSVAVGRADLEIGENDVLRVLEAARAVNIPHNRVLVHTLTSEFIVDGVGDIADPLGMIGGKLEVDSFIVDLFAPTIKSLTKAVEMAGGHVGSVVFEPLAIARSLLSKNQKELGSMSLDIGFGLTTLSVFEEGKLLHMGVVPVGSSHITNDIAIGLKSSIDLAEKMKTGFGHAMAKEVSSRAAIDLLKIDEQMKGQVSQKFIIDIIEARLTEILDFVHNELKTIGKAGGLPAGVVLSGGGAKLPGLVDLIKRELRLPAQVGVPDTSAFLINDSMLQDELTDPECAAVVGLMLCNEDIEEPYSAMSSYKNWWRRILNIFIP